MQSHKEQEEDFQDLLEAEVPSFPILQKVESFTSAIIKNPSLGQPKPSEGFESQPQDLSLPLPAIFIKVLISPHEVDWSSPEIDKVSLGAMKDQWGRSIFLIAVEEGRKDTIEVLLKQNVALQTIDSQGNNGLAIAALNGYADFIPLLSDYFPINDPNFEGLSPIHHAINQGHSQTVRALAKNGASLTTSWKSPEEVIFSPAALAVMSGDIATLKVLVEEDYQGDTDLTQPIGNIGNLVHLAIYTDQTPMLRYLLETHYLSTEKLLEHEDHLGRTPLHLASYLGRLEMIKLLKDKVDLSKVDREGNSAAHWAVQGKKPEVIDLLGFYFVNLEIQNRNAETPLSLVMHPTGFLEQQLKARLQKWPNKQKKKLVEPPDFSLIPPHSLVLNGGGVESSVYIGVLQYMHTIGNLHPIKRLAGQSASALIAAFLSFGYELEELPNLFSRSFFDSSNFNFECNNSTLPKIQQVFEIYGSSKKESQQTFRLHMELSNMNGLCKIDSFRNRLDELFAKKINRPHCTFGELSDLAKKDSRRFKELHIFAIPQGRLRLDEIAEFSSENELWRNLVISDAVSASFAIPGLFSSFLPRFKDPVGQLYIRKDLGSYMNPSLIKDFHIERFGNNKYRGRKVQWIETSVLGLKVRIERIEGEEQDFSVSSIARTYFYASTSIIEKNIRDRTIEIFVPSSYTKNQSLLLKLGFEAFQTYAQTKEEFYRISNDPKKEGSKPIEQIAAIKDNPPLEEELKQSLISLIKSSIWDCFAILGCVQFARSCYRVCFRR
ncbi:MAG: ankyrin repeat domain-containing protein [Ignavibacteriae bacterium]|nr:ankyrin repeat domain-containing protein [Ignavibacteriota bacterium]